MFIPTCMIIRDVKVYLNRNTCRDGSRENKDVTEAKIEVEAKAKIEIKRRQR